jgi:hypothetical protein
VLGTEVWEKYLLPFDPITRSRKQALGNVSLVQFKTILKRDKNIADDKLGLKPTLPDKPKKKNTLKPEAIT